MLAPLHPPLLLLLLTRLLLLLLLHSEIIPDGQESLARGIASPDLSASAQEVVAEFVYAGRHNPPGTPSAGPLVGHHSLAWRPLDELLRCSWGCSSTRREGALQQERHALVAQRAMPLRPTSLFLSVFRFLNIFLVISSFHRIVWRICRISYGYMNE